MASAREMAREVLDPLPEESCFADIEYHFRVRESIEKGRPDLREGRTYSTDEVEWHLAPWPAR